MAATTLGAAEIRAHLAAGTLPSRFRVVVPTGSLRPLAAEGSVVDVVDAREVAPGVGDVVVCLAGGGLALRRIVAVDARNPQAMRFRADIAPAADRDALDLRETVVGVVVLTGPLARVAHAYPRAWTASLWAAAEALARGRVEARALVRRTDARRDAQPAFHARPLGPADAVAYADFHVRARRTTTRNDALPVAPQDDPRPVAVGLFTADGMLIATELLAWSGDVVEITTLFVAPEHRRQGAALALGAALVDLARAHGARQILAYINVRHAASEALHRRLGYQPTGAWLTDPTNPFAAMENQLREWTLLLRG